MEIPIIRIEMIMKSLFFYLFSIVSIGGGVLMVTSRDTVKSALYMITSLMGVACLMGLLEAYLLAILQVLVYAGAVMVLFVFVIMLLNIKASLKRHSDKLSVVASVLGLALLVAGVVYLCVHSAALPVFEAPAVGGGITATAPFDFTTSAKSFGYGLFTKYMLPFQVVGFLLLIAMVGIIVICKRQKALDPKEK